MKHLIAPSVLACDFARLPEEIALLNDSAADWIHLDVMDGRFVPNLTFGMPLVEAINRLTDKTLDVHLMMLEPERYVEAFQKAGADWISVHYEACPHLHRNLQQIKATGAKAGVAINPHTPVEALFPVLEEIDLVIIMSVNPGFGGQKFIYHSIDKIKKLKEEIIIRNLPTLIEVDGGVGMQNAQVLLQAGADVLVAGSAVFKAPDPKKAIQQLKNIGGLAL
ncbi:ribulose-phosphate 3-epimerase [Saprospira grandis DSM 2844]|uniref:Ribulose-phosphate 3-epimerase n=1 Tax=Saprospira grandis DSM 2844 TaxID=694433 RepID=J0P3J9_9BACT|nr:ribulose-phosphate 3-epimerase [Saprospira grandis]EJF51992.1 ribulose-phosphate 3-epimerase [Saprospira grandis DSM 2844]